MMMVVLITAAGQCFLIPNARRQRRRLPCEGLASATQIVEQHGGTTAVESRERERSTFSFYCRSQAEARKRSTKIIELGRVRRAATR